MLISNSSVSFLSGPNGYTAKIQDALNRTRLEFMYIGMLLIEVDNFGYYTEAGFSNVYEYAENTFGFKRSSTNNFMRVYRRFGEGIGVQQRFINYSYSQLVEMCSMDDNQIVSCSPDMTVSDLRDVKKGFSVQTSGREVTISSLSVSPQSFEDVVKVPHSNLAHLHCPICDYYFTNNSDFYKYCHICGSRYDFRPINGD